MVAKSATALAIFALAGARAEAQGIAAGYPGDAGIEANSNVLFVERFEETSTAPIFARWESVSNPANITLDTDVPAGSPGTRSVRMVKGAGDNGASLYRRLTPGENDRVYMRYYIKYSSGGYHHAGGQLGGYNPSSPWPQGTAGIVPTGADHFTIGLEPVSGPNYRFEFYVYWKDMSGIWGNYFINDPSLLVPLNQWACCEIMVKLNNPVSAANGELAVWINGQPRGPYTGLQWRTTTALNLNWIWLLHYVTTQTPAGSTKWDHLVVARNYIGPLSAGGPAPTLPAAPSGLTATAVSSSQINLGWTDNASNETGFKIERRTGTAAYAQVATVGANATSYSNTGLAANTLYTYRVRATNGAGDSATSNEASATTSSSSGGADPDMDGLTNAQELALGTDPARADTDGDGASDGQEVAAGTDPLDPLSVPGGGAGSTSEGSEGGCGATGLEPALLAVLLLALLSY